MRRRNSSLLVAAALCLAPASLAPGCTGTFGDAPSRPGDAPTRLEAPTERRAPVMRRLTEAQYRNSVADLLGEGIAPSGALEPDAALNGLVAIGSSRVTISPRGVEMYEAAAFDVAAQAFARGRANELVSCTPTGTVDASCTQTFVTEFGRRAWRRPLTSEEIATYTAIATRAAGTLGSFEDGIQFAIAGLLQSPNFLFRIEEGEDGDSPGVRRLTSLEMATRLSYTLWNTTPDEALLAAGEAGELSTREGIQRHAERLLASPRARATVRDFFSQMLRLEGLSSLPQNPALFPQASPTIGPAMREATLLSLETQLLDDELPYRALFDSRTTFVNRELAALYEIPFPTDREAAGEFVQVELPADGPRAGLLGEGSLLALLSHAHASSPTVRGKFVREALLCQSIPPPPPDVGELPEPSPDLPTMRERLRAHRENPACASCHAVTDPIGLGLENFDAIGAFREFENEARIDASGELDGRAFADARELGEALRDHDDLASCLARTVYRYAAGHVENRAEAASIEEIAQRLDGSTLTALLMEIVTSDNFRLTGSVE